MSRTADHRPTAEHFTATELQDTAGITYRQLDYWTTTGYLRADLPDGTGSGHARYYPLNEVRIARLMRRLIEAGLTVDVAANVARNRIESPKPVIDLTEGVHVVIDFNGSVT